MYTEACSGAMMEDLHLQHVPEQISPDRSNLAGTGAGVMDLLRVGRGQENQ